jgi:hypothetical protein
MAMNPFGIWKAAGQAATGRLKSTGAKKTAIQPAQPGAMVTRQSKFAPRSPAPNTLGSLAQDLTGTPAPMVPPPSGGTGQPIPYGQAPWMPTTRDTPSLPPLPPGMERSGPYLPPGMGQPMPPMTTQPVGPGISAPGSQPSFGNPPPQGFESWEAYYASLNVPGGQFPGASGPASQVTPYPLSSSWGPSSTIGQMSGYAPMNRGFYGG